MGEWIGDGADMDYMPSEIASIINKKEGIYRFDDKEKEIISSRNKKNEYFLKNVVTKIPKQKLTNYKPKNVSVPVKKPEMRESDRLWFRSTRYNLDKLVYAWLYKEVYINKSSIGCIIEETSKIYSWAAHLRGFEKAGHILWFQIRNVDERYSKLTYCFNHENLKIPYIEYLQSVAYCIDNGLDK